MMMQQEMAKFSGGDLFQGLSTMMQPQAPMATVVPGQQYYA